MASALFSPITLRGLTVPNRAVVSPMCQYNSTDGNANDWHIMHIGQFVLGGFGLIIAEMTDINPVGRISLKCAGLYSDENEKSIKRVLDFAKQYGPSKHGLQIGHAGRKGSTKPPAMGGTPLSKEEGAWETLAPSAIPYDPTWHVPRAMTKDELKSTLDDYVASVKRAERAGYDLLELHAAHGYLLHQFLSPLSNQRTDEYGGSLENRMRFPLEVARAVRAAWPKHKPAFVRISVTDWIEGGVTVAESVAYAKELKAIGYDVVHCTSSGFDGATIPVGPLYQVPLAEAVRKGADVPTAAVGLITKAQDAEKILENGQADLIALARQALDDPNWPLHAMRDLLAGDSYGNWPLQSGYAVRNKDRALGTAR